MADPTGPDLPAGLTEREYLIAQEMIFGAKPTPIAAKLNLTRQTVWEVMQKEHVKRYVADNIEHVRLGNLRLITSAVGTAISTLVEICADKTAAKPVRVSAAGHLVRAGITQRHEVTGPNGGPVQSVQLDPEKIANMDPEQLRALREALVKL